MLQNITQIAKKVFVLVILNRYRQHWLAFIKFPALLGGITSKHHGDFVVWKAFTLSQQKKKRELHKNVCENNYFGHVAVPSEVTKILESNQYQKSDKSLSVIYTDLECLKEKTD